MKNIYFLLFSLLISSNLIAQSGFITEESTMASFKMGSMQSSVYKYFSEDTYYSKMDFSFKGKGLARLMSRDVENGTIISFKDSTIIKINHKKNRFTKKLLSEFLEERKSESVNESENQENSESDEENFTPVVSDTLEIINGFDSYKVTLNEENRTQSIWVTDKAQQSDIVISMQSKIDEFESNWVNLDIDLSELGMNENAIIVKAMFSDEDGSFEYNLKTYSPIDSMPDIFQILEEYKKVKKL
ncbi:MAG TPA: hypothetical protein EYO99_02715 [Candidatus Marinimicrobia bacterium]|nr:hypothetical protein [Candidatus Neomarinimicrobiota bacterium]